MSGSTLTQPGLTAAQKEQFADEGYLVVENVLDPDRDIAPVMAEYGEVLDGIAQSLHAEGVISSTYSGLGFSERLIQVCQESGRNFPQHFDISLPQIGVEHDTPMHVGPAVFGLLTNPRLLDVAESIVGPDIYSNPVQHIRMKLPKRAVATGGYNGLVEKVIWHQDNGVILPEADESTILTVWLPLSDATVENGCLAVIPRSHRDDLMPHCPTTIGTGIPTKLLPLERETPLPMKAGSILLMTSRTVHQSLDNLTNDDVRLSFDLRYQPIGQPTGRPMFPGFLARSASHREATLTNPAEWARLWYETRARMAARENPSFNRWSADSPLCA